MIRYLSQRVAWGILVLVGISVAVFVVVHLSGDPTALYMSPEGTRADYELLRAAIPKVGPQPDDVCANALVGARL